MYFDPLLVEPTRMVIPNQLLQTPPLNSSAFFEQADCIIRSDNPNQGSLFIGNLEASESIKLLKELRIGSLLTCARGYAMTEEFKEGSKLYKYLPLEEQDTYKAQMKPNGKDLSTPNSSCLENLRQIQGLLIEGAQFIKQSLRTSNVLVHCVAGANRSIAVVAAYLIQSERMKEKDAIAYIKNKRRTISCIGPIFMEALKEISLNCLLSSRQNTQRSITQSSRQQTQRSNRQSEMKAQKTDMSNIVKNIPHLQTPSNQSVSMAFPVKQAPIDSGIVSKVHSKNYDKRSQSVEHSRVSQKSGSSHSKAPRQQSKNVSVDLSQIRHQEPKHFEMILSSSHKPQCIGVKRELKNSIMSAKKEINMSSTCLDKNNNRSDSVSGSNTQSRVRECSHQLENVSEASSKSIVSGRSRIQNSRAASQMGSSRARSALSGSRVSSSVRQPLNEENPENSNMWQSQDLKLSPSKKLHFRDVNDQLNFDIDCILKEYESATRNIQNSYHQRLRGVRVGRNQHLQQ